MECTENALRIQKRRFEAVAASYMLGSEQVFQSEQARWRQELFIEDQRLAIYGKEEATQENTRLNIKCWTPLKTRCKPVCTA